MDTQRWSSVVSMFIHVDTMLFQSYVDVAAPVFFQRYVPAGLIKWSYYHICK